MRLVARGMLGIAAAAGLVAAYGCGSDITDEPTGPGGSSGTGAGGTASGAAGSGGGETFPCTPTEPICYGGEGRGPGGPGSECLANLDNTGKDIVQFRQTWSRVVSPPGNTEDIVYGILRSRAQVNLPGCYQTGLGGYIQMSSWDRTNRTDKTQQTVTTGYASYSGARNTITQGQTPGADVVRDGLCFIDWQYSYNGPPLTIQVDTSRWPEALPQPWSIKPVVSKRLDKDFTTTAEVKSLVTEQYAGVVYIDEDTGYIHGYSPLSYVTVLDNPNGGLATPIREVELKSQFNDNSFNCMGRFRADKMVKTQNCDPGGNQTNPQWGCEDDTACPPKAGFGDTTGPGSGPGYTTGYFLIVDIERVYSTTLTATLCVTYPGQQKSIADGWAKSTNEGGWGMNCRGSPKWNPSLPDDAGLPMGDWCSRENKPATATCHDAYLSRSYSTAQSFKVKPVTKTGPTTFTGTCNVAM
jgi:hypothetical protein